MIELQWPWALLLFFVAPIVYFLVPAVSRHAAALHVPSLETFRFDELRSPIRGKLSIWSRVALQWLLWGLVVLAFARPHVTGDSVSLPTKGRDLFLAVDISGSMNTDDMVVRSAQVSRIVAVKHVVGDFLSRRDGDRVGLILFGSQPYVYAPLTYDIATVNQLMQEAPVGIAGMRTSIGDTVGLAVKRLQERPEDHRVLVLLTDGSQNAGVLQMNQATTLASENAVRIYTIGIGAHERTDRLFGGFQIRRGSDLDEQPLRDMALGTGGQYFRASNVVELENVYAEINALEKVEQDEENYRPQKSLYYVPLGMAALLYLFVIHVRFFRRR